MSSSSEVVIRYAREVYAACATVGFENASVRQLKALLDAKAVELSAAKDLSLLELAQQVQIESVAWMEERSKRYRSDRQS